MIFAKEQAFLKARQALAALEQMVDRAADGERRIDLVERDLFAGLLQVGRELLSAFVAAAGDGDVGPTIEHETKTLRRLADKRSRRYVSIFGELAIERRVYAERAKQREQAPLDARLGLPAGDFSYVLEDWLERLCVREAYAEACGSLADLLGVKVGVRAAEQMSQVLARATKSFRVDQPPPPAEEEGEILVATFDGKGIPMRRPLEQRGGPDARRADKPAGGAEAAAQAPAAARTNQKQMACVAGVYSIDRFRRTADDVLNEVRRNERKKDRPRPKHKRLSAELTHVRAGQEYNGRSLAFIGAAIDVAQRDPLDEKPIVCVTDGERALIDEMKRWLPARTIHILDIMHALSWLWKAAHCFHSEKSRAAEEFVDDRLRLLLEGRTGRVIGGLRRMLDQPSLTKKQRRALRSVIVYFDNHRDSMRYDQYLAAGYPIGSGVVEGACRHLVKDRMEGAGMRWTVAGARAILQLRAVYLNDDWDEYVDYRIETEQAALYKTIAA